MQISDMLGQYNRNASQNISVAAPTPGVQQLVEAVRELTVGNIFEGTVNEMKKGQVVLGLSNGETVTARIAGNISLALGQSMFFQVKSNNGTQVEIRPYVDGNQSNPTLLKALDAAGIPVSERTISMVNAMMEEQMPISKQSLWDMARLAAGQADVDVATLVQMKKLDIPVTTGMASQFENYRMDRAAITDQMNSFVEKLPGAFADAALTEEGAWNLSSKILDTLLPSLPELQQIPAETVTGAKIAELSDEAAANPAQQPFAGLSETAEAGEDGQAVLTAEKVHVQADYPENTIGRLLSASQLSELEQQLKGFPQVLHAPGLFQEDSLNPELSVREFLASMQRALQGENFAELPSMKKLLSSASFQKLFENIVEQTWLVKPQDLETEDKVKELYQKLDRQMNQLEQVFRQAGMDGTDIARAAVDVRSNIEFMNQINQTWHYVQIPLKMSGQKAHGDLYVYSNKKNLEEPEGDLTAFLHLDMEHLGSTDVSVKMHDRQVHTEFYLGDGKSSQVIQEHMDILQERLEKKGYACTVHVNQEEKKINFVEDFLKQDQPVSGRVHRYSFDVRA